MLLSFLLASAALAEPTTYTLQPAESALYVVVYYDRDRWALVKAHDHVVVATEFTGTVTWDAEDLSTCAVDISFPVTNLEVDPPGYRERENLDPEGAIEEDTKLTVIKNMMKKGNLWGENFPEISYKATTCVSTGSGVVVTGVLDIRGLGKEVVVPMAVTAGPERFTAKGSFSFDHAYWDMKPFTYGPTTPKNGDPIKFVVDLVGTAEVPKTAEVPETPEAPEIPEAPQIPEAP